MAIKDAINKIVLGKDLTETEMETVMGEVMGGAATPAQIGSFITALRMKGETVSEVTGAVKVMRQKATSIDTGIDLAGDGILVGNTKGQIIEKQRVDQRSNKGGNQRRLPNRHS